MSRRERFDLILLRRVIAGHHRPGGGRIAQVHGVVRDAGRHKQEIARVADDLVFEGVAPTVSPETPTK